MTQLAMPTSGPYPAHVARVLMRAGDPGDPQGEHAVLLVTACDDLPRIVGTTYRMPCRGGAPHWRRMSEAAVRVAMMAPHVACVLAGAE